MKRILAVPSLERALLLSFGLTVGVAAGCVDSDGGSDCSIGSFGCTCYSGGLCLPGLTCLSDICVDLGDDGETGGPGDGDEGDGDTGPGDGDGDTGPGDGDGDTGPGDGDGEPAGDPCGAGAEILLYEQGNNFSNDPGITAGSFTNDGGKSIELADDFVVPADESCWCITRVTTYGFYKDGVAPSSTPDAIVEFFAPKPAGVPEASPSWSYSGPLIDDDGDFDVPIDEGIVLHAGTHWFSFRPVLSAVETLWYWKMHDTISGDMAAARDKDTLVFDGKCTGWTPAIGCYNITADGYEDVTMQFQLFGIIGGEECN